MTKSLRILIMYRMICENYILLGRAVSISEIKRGSDVSHGSVYSYLNELMKAGYIIKVAQGFYSPVDIYRWHFEDLKGLENE